MHFLNFFKIKNASREAFLILVNREGVVPKKFPRFSFSGKKVDRIMLLFKYGIPEGAQKTRTLVKSISNEEV